MKPRRPMGSINALGGDAKIAKVLSRAADNPYPIPMFTRCYRCGLLPKRGLRRAVKQVIREATNLDSHEGAERAIRETTRKTEVTAMISGKWVPPA